MRGSSTNNNNHNNNNGGNQSTLIALPRANQDMEEVAGAQDTIYLCNFRVSVDGEWLCLKELQDLDIQEGGSGNGEEAGPVANLGIANSKCEERIERDWANYCRCLLLLIHFQLSFYVSEFRVQWKRDEM